VLGSVIGARDGLTYLLVPLAGAMLGAPFGVVAFPIAYYAMLRELPMRRTLLAIAYGTIVAGWIGSLVAMPKPGDSTLVFLLKIYTPATLGLIGASQWLCATPVDARLSRAAKTLLVAIASAALILCFLKALRTHTV
jgi:hypothetical protein